MAGSGPGRPPCPPPCCAATPAGCPATRAMESRSRTNLDIRNSLRRSFYCAELAPPACGGNRRRRSVCIIIEVLARAHRMTTALAPSHFVLVVDDDPTAAQALVHYF